MKAAMSTATMLLAVVVLLTAAPACTDYEDGIPPSDMMLALMPC